MDDAADWISELGLAPNPEGGYFRQYHAAPFPDGRTRPLITVIYYLLTAAAPRARMHRSGADGLHFHHAGGVLRVHSLGPDGDHRAEPLGPPHAFQVVVAGGRWKAIELVDGPWALISEAVVPGWSIDDHASADATVLEGLAPELRALLGPFVHEPSTAHGLTGEDGV